MVSRLFLNNFLCFLSDDVAENTLLQKAPRTSSERLMYVQFTSCVYGEVPSLDKKMKFSI